MPDAPMADARLDEIQAAVDQYKAKRAAAQNALIDHDRSEVLRQESYAGCIAEIFTQEYGPELIAEVRRARAESERRRVRLRDADNDLLEVRGHLSPNGYPQRVPVDISGTVAPAVEWLLAEVEKLRAENAELEKRDDWLRSLEAAGVDNWEGIDAANEIHEQEA